MIGRLNHVAIAVASVENAAQIYKNALGAKVSEPETLAEHGVKVIFVELPNTKIELLEPFGESFPGLLRKTPQAAFTTFAMKLTTLSLPVSS